MSFSHSFILLYTLMMYTFNSTQYEAIASVRRRLIATHSLAAEKLFNVEDVIALNGKLSCCAFSLRVHYSCNCLGHLNDKAAIMMIFLSTTESVNRDEAAKTRRWLRAEEAGEGLYVVRLRTCSFVCGLWTNSHG